jgi:hypothetical protein
MDRRDVCIVTLRLPDDQRRDPSKCSRKLRPYISLNGTPALGRRYGGKAAAPLEQDTTMSSSTGFTTRILSLASHVLWMITATPAAACLARKEVISLAFFFLKRGFSYFY